MYLISWTFWYFPRSYEFSASYYLHTATQSSPKNCIPQFRVSEPHPRFFWAKVSQLRENQGTIFFQGYFLLHALSSSASLPVLLSSLSLGPGCRKQCEILTIKWFLFSLREIGRATKKLIAKKQNAVSTIIWRAVTSRFLSNSDVNVQCYILIAISIGY